MKNNKKYSLEHKNCIITGAAGLLGQEHAEAILEAEGNVILTDVNVKKLKELKNKLHKTYEKEKVAIFFMDVCSERSIKKVINHLKKIKTKINVLINNASLNPSPNSSKNKNDLENFDLRKWNSEIQVGLTGVFLCTKHFGALMKENNEGSIINIASDLSLISPDQRIYNNQFFYKPITYSAIKTGIVGITRYTSTYWAEYNIRCNALSPGGVYNQQDKLFVKKLTKLIPLARMAKKNEYKSAIQFMASDASSYMTGHNLVMDGGRTVW